MGKFPRTDLFWKFRHGKWRNRICESSQRPSAKSTEKNVEHCRELYRTFNNMGNVFMGKNFSTIQSVVKNHESLTLKQMFDVTAQLVNNQEEISCLDKICMGRILGHICHWLMTQWSSIFKAQKSMYSQNLCYVSAKFFNILNATKLGRIELRSTSREKLQRIWCYQRRLDGIRVEHFPRVHNVAALW